MRLRSTTSWAAAAAGGMCLTATAAEGTKQAEFLPGRIVPGKSIGTLRLGMSERAARQALRGLDRGSRLEKHIRKGTATEYLEYTYPTYYTSYTIGYLGRPGKRRVVLVITHVDENKTRQGVGVSATHAKLLRTHRNLQCEDFFIGVPSRTECLLGSRKRSHTIFVVDVGDSALNPPHPRRVVRVLVQQPFKRF